MAKNLLIICCGKDSLHQQWKQLHVEHGFDLALLIYDGSEYTDENSKAAKWMMQYNGRKFENIHKFLKTEDVSEYEYIGNIDDDILTTPHDLGKIFEMGKKHNFDLFSPALTEDSYINHIGTRVNRKLDFRTSNVVEIMNPFWSKRALDACVDDFVDGPNKQGYGLEYSWEAILESKQTGKTKFDGWVAIIDRYPVKHTRPTNNRLDLAMPDMHHFQKKYGIDPNRHGIFIEEAMRCYVVGPR